jgi:hypothetical protein
VYVVQQNPFGRFNVPAVEKLHDLASLSVVFPVHDLQLRKDLRFGCRMRGGPRSNHPVTQSLLSPFQIV